MLNWRKPSRNESSTLDGSTAKAFGRAAKQTVAWAGMALLMAACGTTPRTVPVVDRTTPARQPEPSATEGRESSRLVDAENYVVKRGDTLVRIALDHGEDWRDIAQWNNLSDPNQIRPGQVLRIERPAALAAAKPAHTGTAHTSPITGPAPAAPRPLDSPAPAPTPTPAPQATAPTPAPAPSAKPPAAPVTDRALVDGVSWGWPANGSILETFHETRNKGLDISGALGDPVLAAADGKVVYSGSGLRGYGKLIIIKHNSTFLSAYAHNRAMLIKEGQAVRRGQKIAELGQTDTDTPRLHFEIRRQGKPVDPSTYLPKR